MGRLRRCGSWVAWMVVGVLAGLALGVGASQAAESTMHIKFSTWHPPASREVKTVWIPMLEESQ